MRPFWLLVLVAASAQTQAPRPVPLVGSPQRLTHAFTSVDAVRELRDGRIVVVERTERSVSVGDFATQQVTPVSHRGSGPLEYRQPRGAFSLADGGVVVSDPANARFLRLSPDGRALGPWRPVTERGQAGTTANLSAIWDARAVDAKGRLYFEALPPPLPPGRSATVPIVRLDPALGRSDTVARYTLTAEMQTLAPTAGGRGTAIIRPRAWPPRPEWAVAPDGAVAIVTPAPYRVTLIANGERHDGPPTEVPSLRVTEADRAAFSDAARRDVRGPSGAGAEPPRPAGAPAPTRKQGGAPLFPDVMPPFTGRDAVHVAPDGRVWVARSRHASDSVQVIDVFAVDGRIDGRIALPPHRRLVAFGDSFTYLAFRDPDDLEFVERYPRPAR